MIKLYFRTVKILAKKMPTYISVVAAVLLIMKTFMVKYYDRRIQTNTASIIIIIIIAHVKRDSDCNGNEKDERERETETETDREADRQTFYGTRSERISQGPR